MHRNIRETPVGEIELVVERYWLDGLSLDQARQRASEERNSATAQKKR